MNIKSIEKPLIVKSGETWTAHWEGIDYLCLMPENLDNTIRLENDFSYCVIEGKYYKKWKPFSEIEKEGLTDEIAKLRPMVKITFKGYINGEIFMFTFIDESSLQCKGITVIKDNVYCRLATPHELQEAE